MVQDQQLTALLEAIVQNHDDPSLFLPLFDRLEELGDSRLPVIREIANLECPTLEDDDWPVNRNLEDITTDLIVGEWWYFSANLAEPFLMVTLELRPGWALSELILAQVSTEWQTNGPISLPYEWTDDLDHNARSPWLIDAVPNRDQAALADSFRHLRLQLLQAYLTLMPA